MLKSSTVELDSTDKAILNLLQNDGRITNNELAKKVHLSPPATLARVKRLEQDGYINRYVSILNREKTGHDTICFISVSLELHQPDKLRQFFEAVRQIPQVQECHHLTGQSDYLLKVVLKNNREMEDFISNTLLPMPGMSRVQTSVVLKEIKSSTAIPL